MILINSGLPLFLWAEAVNYMTYMKNCHLLCLLQGTTPYEVCFKAKPDISNCQSFRCKAYVHDGTPGQKKTLSTH